MRAVQAGRECERSLSVEGSAAGIMWISYNFFISSGFARYEVSPLLVKLCFLRKHEEKHGLVVLYALEHRVSYMAAVVVVSSIHLPVIVEEARQSAVLYTYRLGWETFFWLGGQRRRTTEISCSRLIYTPPATIALEHKTGQYHNANTSKTRRKQQQEQQ